MSLVSIDDRAYQPRVLPNVFSDLPSQAELAAAKRSRAGLTFIVILLAGMLIAAVIGLYVLWNQSGAPGEQIAELQRDLAASEARVEDLESQVTQYQAQYGAYSRIHEHRNSGASIRAEIDQLVQNRPWTRNAATAANYQQSIWGAEEGRLTTALEREVERLRILKARLEGMPRPITGPAPAPGQIGGGSSPSYSPPED